MKIHPLHKHRHIRHGIAVFALLLSAGIGLLPSCRKDFDTDRIRALEWNPEIALQLVDDSVTLRRILTQGGAEDHLYIDESGDISILYYYNNDAFRIRPADLLRINNIDYLYNRPISAEEVQILQNGNLALAPVPFTVGLTGLQQDMRVDKMRIKKGNLVIVSENTFANPGYLTIAFPQATLGGAPFSARLEPLASGTSTRTFPLDGVLFDLTSTPNQLKAEVAGLLRQSTSVNQGDQIRTSIRLVIESVASFEGYLGQHVFDGMQDTIRVNVFNNAYALGEVYFVDPQATVTMVNSIGVPAHITIEQMVAINEVSQQTLDIADRLGAGSAFAIPSAVEPLVKPALKTMNYTNANTGNAMHDFFNVKPDHVGFRVKTTINPDGPVRNFFGDTSSFYGDLRIKLPLWGHFDHLTYQDTFDLIIDKPDLLEYLEFKTHLVNGMPFSGLMQVYFTDEQYQIRDSLAGSDRILIREAPVDPATYLPYPGQFGIKDTVYILSKERMLNFENVRKMLVKAVLFSPGQGTTDVKLRADQSIRMRFSARGKISTTFKP